MAAARFANLFLAVTLATCAHASDPPVAAKPDAAALVRSLGSAKYAEREEAQRQLRELGGKALRAVRDGLGSAEPEVATRCRALLPLIRADEWEKARLALKDPAKKAEIDHPI